MGRSIFVKAYREQTMKSREALKFGVLLLAVLLLAVLSFCGRSSTEPYESAGKVTVNVNYGGAPVTSGFVHMVIPGEGKSAYGELNEVGVVTFEKVRTGNYTVSVAPPAPADPDPEKPTIPQEAPNIPKKFRSEATSSLKADVQEGENKFSFELKQ